MNIDLWRKLWRACNIITLFGVAQFVICTLIAISFYPGGAMENEQSIGFGMYDNYLSDLGRGAALNGDKNDTASFWFNNSLLLLSISLIPFYLSFCFHAWDRQTLLWIAAAAGLFSLLGMFVVASSPLDRAFIWHNVGLVMWMVGTIFAAGFHATAILSSQHSPQWLALISFAFAMLVMAYAVGGSLQEYMKMQKIAVAGAICWYATLSIWALFKMNEYLAELEEITPEEQETAEEASQYEFQIRHRGS